MSRIRTLRLLITVVAALAGAAGYVWFHGARGTVTIGTSLAAKGGTPTLRLGDPFRAVLNLDGRIGTDARVDFELHAKKDAEDRQLMMYTVPSTESRDEIYVAWKSVGQLTKGETGEFQVRFLQEGRLLGEGRFTVVP